MIPILLFAALAGEPAAAPEAGSNVSMAAPAAQAETGTQDTVQAAPSSIRIPALTAVELTVLEEVSSKTAVSGQPVKLALASPLQVAPELGLPAGTPVEGLVIHAARGGMGGKSGELLLGAKRIALPDGTAIALRSFKLGPARGRNNETLAFATAVTVGLPALFITGGSARIPAGTIANAKTSADIEVSASSLTRLPPAASAPSITQPVSTQGESK